MQRLLDGLRHGDDAGYVVRCRCVADRDGQGDTTVDHIRLFPLRPEIRWIYRVHEQILPALRRAGIGIRWAEVTIHHHGYTDPSLRQRKLDRDVRLLGLELQERPGDPFVLFNLGWIAIERKDPATALGYLETSLANSSTGDSIVRKLHALIAQAHQMRGDLAAARAACRAGLDLTPDDPELLFRHGIVCRAQGDRDGAQISWRKILDASHHPARFSSIATGITGAVTRKNLALLHEERGEPDKAARLWREVLADSPADPDASAALARLGGRPG